ncbi:uncharacterized protein LOC119953204 [Scyliorhinus canicula]|uniref:uncharacterized protein LOC119953204 n=1 Tax=Scyliorhinus canicula TaxID=7830 RepID=UPI0018F510D2|nr:uncharacterized protein LOC119953204 [Scyliorhinus canicula]XP_038633140.1 uncharacterized protein LOC119953204 [Scyliorhinus canicula]
MGFYHTVTFLCVILSTRTYLATQFLTLNCSHSVTGLFDRDTELPCKINTLHLMELRISKNGSTILNGSTHFRGAQGRIKLLHPNSLDISLIIQKTQLSDGGTYQYDVETTSGHRIQTITLKVKAPHHLSSVTGIPITTPVRTEILICNTIGYPLAQIHWFINGTSNLTSSANTSSVKTPQGLFNITSTLQIEGVNVSKGNYSCAVRNVEEIEYKLWQNFSILSDASNIEKLAEEEKKKKILIATSVILPGGLLVIAILVVLEFMRTRHSEVREPSETPMLSSDRRAEA